MYIVLVASFYRAAKAGAGAVYQGTQFTILINAQSKSEAVMNVYKKLQDARIKLQNSELKKSGHNKFAGYYYFELADFLPQTQAIFSELGLCGIVSFTAELASLRIVDIDSEKEITFTSPMGSAALKGCHEVQNIGAVEAYQRRYLWVAAMEIVEHDALDATTSNDAPTKNKHVKSGLSEIEISEIVLSINECRDLDSLKFLFGSAYNKADKSQQTQIKEIYDKQKSLLLKQGVNHG